MTWPELVSKDNAQRVLGRFFAEPMEEAVIEWNTVLHADEFFPPELVNPYPPDNAYLPTRFKRWST